MIRKVTYYQEIFRLKFTLKGKFKISYRPVTVVKWLLTPNSNVELLMYRT